MSVTTLRDFFIAVSENYLSAKQESYERHPVANLIRQQSERLMKPLIENVPGFKVEGSAGRGKWADVPWVVIYDESETDGPQEGVYVAYLFAKDMRRVYLTLMHGVTRPKEQFGKKEAFRRLMVKTNTIRTNSPLAPDQFPDFKSDDEIDLAAHGLGADYARATIFYVQYQLNNLPDNLVLEKHLKSLLGYYSDYLLEDNVLVAGTVFETVGGVEEGKRQLKQHYVSERKPSFIKAIKEYALAQFGELRCEVCAFVFSAHYGDRGKNYIEGHHKNPVSKMPETGAITSQEDIALLCSNCHRMVHAKHPWLKVEELKSTYKR